jgi:hypothetical protein
LQNLVRVTYGLEAGLVNEHGSVGKALHRRRIVRNKNDSAAFFAAFLKMGEAFLGENKITDGKDLI